MAVRWPWKSDTRHHDDGQPSFIMFYFAAVASGFGVTAMFGYLAGLTASNGLWLHTAAHSVITIFGLVTTGVILLQSITAGRK